MSNSLSIADITRLINSILADYSQDEDLSVRLPYLSELTELGDTPRFALERVLEKLDALKERLAQVQIENDLRIKAQRSAGDEYSHNERMTKEAKEDALGEALAKAKQMSFAEAKAVYGDDFKINKTVREMRARGWGVQVRIKTTMRSCGFKHQSFYYEFLHYPKGVR